MNTSEIPLKSKSIKLAPLPTSIYQPSSPQPLSPIPFHLQAANHLTQSYILTPPSSQSTNTSQLNNSHQQINKLRKQLQILYQNFLTQKREHEYWKRIYQEGEAMYHQLEEKNYELNKQIETLKKKKSINRNHNIKKDVPVIRINVPARTTENQPINNDSMYRQLRGASQQVNSMKKLLESEKQKAEYLNSVANKNIQHLTAQKNELMLEINQLKNQNYAQKEEITRLRHNINTHEQKSLESVSTKRHSFDNIISANTHNINSNTLEELKRIQRLHQSCDILISSKQSQIERLKSKLSELEPSNHHSHSFHDKQLLEKHLECSVQEMENMERKVRDLVSQFIDKVNDLKSQLQRMVKKNDSQKFELSKLYELLNEKKHLIEIYEQELAAAKRTKTQSNHNASFTKSPTSDHDDLFTSMLRNRRQMSD